MGTTEAASESSRKCERENVEPPVEFVSMENDFFSSGRASAGAEAQRRRVIIHV